jgi:uncharacterized protein YbbC (DUF1343 family)
MTRFGLDIFLEHYPPQLHGKRIGVLCHAASITADYTHIVDALGRHPDCRLGAIFGPQHGLFGQTQDNMIEWEGFAHPRYGVPVYSLYGQTRRPSAEMLSHIDWLVIDLQDVGARPYTYIWTIKHCLDACAEAGIGVTVLDRPNPIGAVPMDGPMLSPEYFSFVGGARIPLCHRLTLGELSLFLKEQYFPKLQLQVVWMAHWWRRSLWTQTGLPWVLPSPNMPTLDTAIVYPGQVLLEATNLSEGRGTTRPFELFGAPYLKAEAFTANLRQRAVPGCVFREHAFIPTFQKWKGEYCWGMQIHVTDVTKFLPVYATAALIGAALETSDGGFAFKNPPYEYEQIKMPFDILAGDDGLRTSLQSHADLREVVGQWQAEHRAFEPLMQAVSHYPEEPQW